MGKPAERICIECHELRPHAARGRCRSCYRKERYRHDPEYRAKAKIAAGQWNKDHPDRHAGHERARRQRLGPAYAEYERARATTPKRKKWRQDYYQARKVAGITAAQQRAYRRRHPDKANARWAKWYAENPEKVRLKRMVNDQRRLARKLRLPATLTRDQWRAIKAAYGNRCAYCGKRSQRLTQDHVTPLSKGGGYTPDNIVPACRSCNSSKGNRSPLSLPAIRLMV